MDVNSVLAYGNLLAYTNITQMPQVTALPLLNHIYQEVCTDIININELYYKQKLTIDTVVLQNSYTLTTPTSTVSTNTVRKILEVSYKYANPDYPAFQAFTDYNQLDKILHTGLVYMAKADFTSWAAFSAWDWQQIYEWYVVCDEQTYGGYDVDAQNFIRNQNTNALWYNNQFFWNCSQLNPIYFFQNNEILIYPFATEAVKEWLKIECINFPQDLAIGGSEASIRIEREYHMMLCYGLAYMIFQTQGKINESTDMKLKYDIERQKCLVGISDRTISPNYAQTTNLYYLE